MGGSAPNGFDTQPGSHSPPTRSGQSVDTPHVADLDASCQSYTRAMTPSYGLGAAQLPLSPDQEGKINRHTTSSILDSPANENESTSQIPKYDSDVDIEYHSAGEQAEILVPNEPSKPRKISQKKKIEQANFSKWWVNNEQSLSKKVIKLSSRQDETLAYMVKKWEGSEKIITKARDYQLELFDRAKKENTIAVLDTGKLNQASMCETRG